MLSVPGGAIAAQNCSIVVCADAVAVSDMDCESVDYAGYDIIECSQDFSVTAGGSSPVSLPGSATYAGALSYSYTLDGGATWNGPFPWPFAEALEGSCSWPGTGEDSCGGSVSDSYLFTYYVPDFTCLSTFAYRLHADASASASKSLPLGLGTADSVSVSDSAVAGVLDLPLADRCAFP